METMYRMWKKNTLAAPKQPKKNKATTHSSRLVVPHKTPHPHKEQTESALFRGRVDRAVDFGKFLYPKTANTS
jgi:hypothetical protein